MSNGMNDDEELTGVPDEQYNLISALYHLLESVETYEIYIEDSEEGGDDELVEFFSQVQESNRQMADRAKQLLKSRLT